jgi:hypothetical protein
MECGCFVYIEESERNGRPIKEANDILKRKGPREENLSNT